jgi:hypothetical protein
MTAVIVNLILAVFWLLIGGVLLVIEWQTGQVAFAGIRGINVGWLMILFCAFNLFRAGYNWSYMKRRQRQIEADNALRQQWDRRHTDEPPQPPDPNLRFTDD